MKCKECGSDNVAIQSSVVVRSKSRSFLWNLVVILFTGGIWLFWMLLRKRKEKESVVTTVTCQRCAAVSRT